MSNINYFYEIMELLKYTYDYFTISNVIDYY
jgi:hypothetical protein